MVEATLEAEKSVVIIMSQITNFFVCCVAMAENWSTIEVEIIVQDYFKNACSNMKTLPSPRHASTQKRN
jgi:hypothetical protein